jgi:hypothetical protein
MTVSNNNSSPITNTSPPSERYRYALTAFNDALPPGSSSGGGDNNDAGGLRSRRQRGPPVRTNANTNSANNAQAGWNVSIGENYKYIDDEEDGTIFSDGGGAYNNKQQWIPKPNEELLRSQQQNYDGENDDDNSNSTTDTHQQQQSSSFRTQSLLDDVGEEGEDENNIGPPKVMAGGGEGIERQRTISFQEQQRLHDILSSGRSNKRAVNDTSRMSKNNHGNNIDNDDDGYIHDVDINSDEGGGERGNIQQLLQPDAIYEERYGDAYVDQSIKYLYPEGYQSMRPRSGPWRLSVLIFIIFASLNIFVVGHCYDRGVRDYYNNNSGSSSGGMVDDEYLQDVDDDSLLMETRWCGSRPLYFMWLVSVWITVSSSSYCLYYWLCQDA